MGVAADEMLSPQLEVSTEAQVETKAASHGYTHSEQDLALHNLTTSGYRDMDYDLYDAALQLFKERLDEYDLPLQENTYQQWRKEGTRQGRPRLIDSSVWRSNESEKASILGDGDER